MESIYTGTTGRGCKTGAETGRSSKRVQLPSPDSVMEERVVPVLCNHHKQEPDQQLEWLEPGQ